MGEVPGFARFDRPEPTEDEAFEAAGYVPELVLSSSVGVYTIWSKIQSDKVPSDDTQNS